MLTLLDTRGGARGGRGGGRGGRGGYNNNPMDQPPKENSIEPNATEWKQETEIELSSLGKINLTIPEAKDLVSAGTLDPYNGEFDRVTPKAPKSLMRMENLQFFNTTTSEDPIMLRLIKQKVYTYDSAAAFHCSLPCPLIRSDPISQRHDRLVLCTALTLLFHC
jgi:hypothetical protein